LLVNITGGEDIKLFEVDQAVNKIRAEVDPEAELIFGAIKDENLNGKMRVSIVATALDGDRPESKSVINNVHRIHTRNSGYSTAATTPVIPDLGSIEGATALKLNEEVREEENISTVNKGESVLQKQDDLASGVSLENAAYFENNLNQDQDQKIEDQQQEEVVIEDISLYEGKSNDISETDTQEETSPQLFSDEGVLDSSSEGNSNDEILRDEEEEFEIPAFLRNQKF